MVDCSNSIRLTPIVRPKGFELADAVSGGRDVGPFALHLFYEWEVVVQRG